MFKFHDQTTEVTAKAKKVLGLVKRSFEHLNSCMVSKLFTTLSGQYMLEYSNPIWAPLYSGPMKSTSAEPYVVMVVTLDVA